MFIFYSFHISKLLKTYNFDNENHFLKALINRLINSPPTVFNYSSGTLQTPYKTALKN